MTTTPPAQKRVPPDAGDSGETSTAAPRSRASRNTTSTGEQPATGARRAPAPARAPTGRPSTEEPSDGAEPSSGGRRVLGYRRQRFEARKVRRLIRHVDPWSMLKLALLVSLCMWLIGMIASVILWTVARNAGTIESIEDLVNSSLSLQNWSLDGEFIFRQFGVLSLLFALGLTAAVVVATLVFNLVSDIIGGVWISVIEEETARPVAESNQPSRVS